MNEIRGRGLAEAFDAALATVRHGAADFA